MIKKLLVACFLFASVFSKAEMINNYTNEFNTAYQQYPQVPRGILEAVSYTQTHFKHISNPQVGCIGVPVVSGVMGLTENGQGYFRNNLVFVSNLSGYSIENIKNNPSINILAYAKAYAHLVDSLNISSNINEHDIILKQLSEIPWDHTVANNFALNTFVYQILDFIKSTSKQQYYGFPNHNVNLLTVFGQNNFDVLSSESVTINGNVISGPNNLLYQPQYKSAEYAPALWVATPSCNRSSRSGTAISAVAIHTIQGTYAGAISWAQNCSANVSYHYVERSSDGQVTQMVYEADKAWHIGSANPYTIGIEHEGYVNDASWYTEAMYVSSANLVRDITNSGYGINSLRTFYGAASSGTNTLGACTTIKGHQHYANQSHTDPGINWNWEHYYQLINNTPVITTLTTTNGSFYDTGGVSGNYSNDERDLYLIQPVGATSITLSFSVFDLEQNWDFMYIYDGNSTTAPLIGVYTGNSNPTTISSSGGEILIEFRSDCATTAAGWEVSWISATDPVIGDVTAPITIVNALSNWNTVDFTATFNDQDNVGGSGVFQQFYQVINYDGIEWRANETNGFYSDNFDLAIHADWTQQTALWTINGGFLQCADEAESNSNIFSNLNQSNDDTYLYHWAGQISGTGTNRRAGIHFMCSDATQSQRGDSYMVYFRADNDKIQIYKVTGNAIVLEQDISFTINDNQFYDFKIIYDKLSGKISVYVDNSVEATWVDPQPFLSGNSVSFRSGNCIYDVNNFKVYHNRGLSELVTINTGNDIPYQNQNALTPSGRVKSIIVDSAFNISTISFQDVNVDWTNPSNVGVVDDGLTTDIATFSNNNSISANWSMATDVNSDISSYWYAIGTSSGATDVVNWTDNWFDINMTHSGLSLVVGTTYYVSVKSQNGAGLFSDVITSNGQLLESPVGLPTASFSVANTHICATDSLFLENNSINGVSYAWSAPGAIPSTSNAVNPYFNFTTSGSYTVTLTVTGAGGTDTEIQVLNIEVDQPALSSFNVSATVVDIDFPNVTFTNTSQNANGYFWDFGDGQTSTDTNPWHNYTQVGTYDVMCVAINGVCANDTSWATVQVIDQSGIEDKETLNIKVFPNPFNSELKISNHNQTTVYLTIFDSRGKVVKTQLITVGNNTINTDELAKGLYFIQLKSDVNLFYQEIIKQ